MRDEMTLQCDLFSTTPLTDESGDCVEYAESGFSGTLVQRMKDLKNDYAGASEMYVEHDVNVWTCGFRTHFYQRAHEIAIDMKRERPTLIVKVFLPDNIFSDDLGLVEINFRETHSMGLIDERYDEAESAEDLDAIMVKIFCEKISEAFSFINKAVTEVVDDMQKKNGAGSADIRDRPEKLLVTMQKR